MVSILARRGRAKIPMARPNELDVLPKDTINGTIGVYRTQRRLIEHDIVAMSGQWLDFAGY